MTGLRLRIALFMAETCSTLVPLLATCASIVGKTKLVTNHWAVVGELEESESGEEPWVMSLVWVE